MIIMLDVGDLKLVFGLKVRLILELLCKIKAEYKLVSVLS